MKNGQFPEIIKLGDLNGQNGFKLDGENNGDQSGGLWFCRTAGDINGDGYSDLFIGANRYLGGAGKGRSYVVFGGPGVGGSGIFNLSSLTGSNGFKLDGENNVDNSGYSVAVIGDMNGDGHADLLIGAYGYLSGSSKGRSYVVFGGPGVGSSGVISLSNLTGVNGFKLDGENPGDQSGASVGTAGDINGDGYADLVIGADAYPGHNNKGRSYVVFGGPGVGSGEVLSLSSLTGANGFKLDGENNNDASGTSVGPAGDINNDGHTDLFIGANWYPGGNHKGRGYVIFGGPEMGGSEIFTLSNLNGANGFKLDGENNGDFSSQSFSAVGDINGDGHSDLIIGAYGYLGKGRSYAVFGGTGVGSSGGIALSDLNGANGFKLDGESGGDRSGVSVGAADINDDGYADLIIGAQGYPESSFRGRSYVVFGGLGVGQSGDLPLSSLNGSNGFKLDGENNNDYSGYSVSAAGDINGDGVADLLIGAYGYNNNTGRSYVIFGDVPPVVVNNSLLLFSGAIVLLSPSNLAIYDRNHDNDTLVFIPTDIIHGQFESINNSGVMLNNFTQQQIWNNQIQFVHDGGNEAPAYNITVRSDGIAWIGPIPANISFNTFLKLEKNQLVINQGDSVIFTPDNLKATYYDEAESDLIFIISNLTHGRFEFVSTPNQSISIFQQQNITDGVVRFVHDNLPTAPSYRVAVNNGAFTTSAQQAVIDFDAQPILVRNALTIKPGQTVTLTASHLYATHTGVADPNLLFIVTDIQNGFFNISNNQGNVTFSQQQVMNEAVFFSQQGAGLSLPAYRVSVSDKRITTSPVAAKITLKQGQFPEIFKLGDLNGKNGFKIDGEQSGDLSGMASATGDVNADGYDDILIGALGYGGDRGRGYVVFGGPKVGCQGLLNLASLNGFNGFKMDAEGIDYCGQSVGLAGDVNGDGYADVLIGAWQHNTLTGRSYVIFGGPNISRQNPLPLSSLNGVNGFKLDGETNNEESGWWLDLASDINGDGYTDLIIGARRYAGNTGRAYIVFGGPNIGSQGVFSLGALNGANGFKAEGEVSGDYCGFWVSTAGDINADGYNDVLIGAPYHNPGRSYLVFGGPNVGYQGSLSLGSLDGAYGFILAGEQSGDSSGSVSSAGDINGDGYADMLIGALTYDGGRGRSYVVFGGPSVGRQGLLPLASLNSSSGFKLDGEMNYDQSGYAVNGVGDINGDGYVDILIGANNYANNTGRSYIVFGGLNVGYAGLVSLGNLDGFSGFKLDGETIGDSSGTSVRSAGDINGDGYIDLLIGAPGYANSKGRTYVVFGDVPPELVNNSLSLNSGDRVYLNANYLAACDRNHDNSTLLFVPTNITHGQFELINNSGVIVSNFTQQQIWDQQIQFIHDGSNEAPSYNITVRSEGIAWTGPISANITFFDTLALLANQLVINQGQSVILNSANLKASNIGKEDGDLSFIISNLTQGKFLFITEPNQAILIFQQQNITDGVVQFVHDNTTSAPSYKVSVSNSTLTTSARSALIDFDASPILLNNSLIINQGQIIALTSAFLSATHPGGDDRMLLFNISSVMHGKFSFTISPNSPIFSFYQQNITDQLIQFSHDNSTQAPNYSVSVSDGRITLKPSAANIDFDISPVLEVNQLVINQGQTIILTDNNLRATKAGNVENNLEFIISAIQQGQFSWTANPDQPVTRFVQKNVTDRHVQFTHNNSTAAPAYKVAVSDGRITILPSDSQIDFDTTPLLVHNQLTIGEGQSVTFTSENLLATHNGRTESNLTFQVTNIQNGGFILLSDPVQQLNGNVSFQQQQVTNGQVTFVSQNSAVPAYQVSVTDGRITTNPQPSNITFSWKPVLTRNQFLANRGQVTVLTTDNIAATRNGSLAKDLQFVVAGTVKQGRFELRSNPGNAIISFYQDDILQHFIQFAHDNSTEAPSYSLKVVDNQSDLSSDTQAGKIILIVNNYFPVNQGENLLITESVLNATGIQPPNDGNIIFTPIIGTVQHGHFALTSSPDYPLSSFQQQQISAHEILFVPDNSATAPSGYLTVSDSQTNGAQGTIACNIDFDVPPILKKAYLKTSLGEQVKIIDINLKATSQTSAANNLIFEISEISHGYFADNDDWQTLLNNFTQQRISNGDIVFITDQSDQSPQFKVSVWDGRLHCAGCPQQADVVFQGENTSGSSLSEAIKNTVIMAAVSGVIGLLFFALRYKHSLNLQRNARPTIDGEEQETYSDALLLPIAREIFSRIKITGCLGYIGKRDYNEYVGAVSVIVAALETKGVIQSDRWNSLPKPKKQRIIDAIAMHTKELVGNNRCCSPRTFTSFYKAEATPRMIRNKAEEIADAVQETLSDCAEAKSSRSRGSVRLTRTGSSLNQSQMQTPLLS